MRSSTAPYGLNRRTSMCRADRDHTEDRGAISLRGAENSGGPKAVRGGSRFWVLGFEFRVCGSWSAFIVEPLSREPTMQSNRAVPASRRNQSVERVDLNALWIARTKSAS